MLFRVLFLTFRVDEYALNQGLHVLVGKPVDISISKAQWLNTMAENSGKVFAIMFNQRTNFLFAKAREIVRSGDLDKLVLEDGKLKWWKLNMSDREYSRHSENPEFVLKTVYCEMESPQPEAAHIGILQNFAYAILYGEELISPGVEGIQERMLSNAAYLSAWNGNALVQLPIDADAFDRQLQQHIQSSSFRAGPASLCKNDAGIYLSRWNIRW